MGDPLLHILLFILVVSSVLLGFGVLVTVLMCRIWVGSRGKLTYFQEVDR